MHPPAAAIRFGRRIADLGQPIDERLVAIDLTQQQIADRFSMSAGTVAFHLRALAQCGVRLASKSPLILDAAELGRLEAGERSPLTEPPATKTKTPRSDDSGADVQVAAIAAIEALAELAVAAGEWSVPFLETAIEAVRGVAAVSAGAAAEMSRGVPRNAAVSGEEGRSTSDLASSLPVDDRESPAESRGRRGTGEHPRSQAEVLELVRPLVDLCERLNLPGVTNTHGLADALSSQPDEAVGAAVATIVRRVRLESRQSGPGRLESPLGFLAAAAVANDPAVFSPSAEVVELRPAEVINEVGDSVAPKVVADAIGAARARVRGGA